MQLSLISLAVTLGLALSPGALAQPAQEQPQSAEDSDQQAIQELQRQRAEFQKSYETLNALNPMSDSAGAPGGELAGTGPIADLQKLLNHPVTKSYMKVFNDPEVVRGVNLVASHPNRNLLLGVQAGWILFILLFRSWRKSKAASWRGRLWVGFYSLLIFWNGSFLAIPAFLIGEPYLDLVTRLGSRVIAELK